MNGRLLPLSYFGIYIRHITPDEDATITGCSSAHCGPVCAGAVTLLCVDFDGASTQSVYFDASRENVTSKVHIYIEK